MVSDSGSYWVWWKKMLSKGVLNVALIFKKYVETTLVGESLCVCVCHPQIPIVRRELSDTGMALLTVGKTSLDLVEQSNFHGECRCWFCANVTALRYTYFFGMFDERQVSIYFTCIHRLASDTRLNWILKWHEILKYSHYYIK